MNDAPCPIGDPAPHKLIAYVTALPDDVIPEDVTAEARLLLLDQMGCIIAAGATEIAPVIAEGVAMIWPSGGPVARGYSLARLGDAMDFDDGYAGTHFGCGAVGAALALADRPGVTGQDLLTAIVAGFEAGGRVASALGTYYQTVDGTQRFLPVWGISTAVVYAAATAAAHMLRLRPEQAIEALSLAGAFAPIPVGAKWSEMVDLPNTKYCDTGWATATGMSGVFLARAGSTGLTNLLDAERGLFVMSSAVNAKPELLVRNLGQSWALRGIRYKKWPCCGMLFGALHVARQLLEKYTIDPTGISSVEVWLPESTVLQRFLNQEPMTFVSRQFSMPHAMAMLLLGIDVGPLWMDANLAGRTDVVALRQRITGRPLQTNHLAEGIVAAVAITTPHGHYEASISAATLAGRRNPVSDEEISAKFRSLVADPHAAQLEEMISGPLATLPASQLVKTLMGARPR